jgi:hypothetical protein
VECAERLFRLLGCRPATEGEEMAKKLIDLGDYFINFDHVSLVEVGRDKNNQVVTLKIYFADDVAKLWFEGKEAADCYAKIFSCAVR